MRSSLLIGCFFLSGTAWAAAQDDLKALRLEIGALQMDRALNLSRDQARSLSPLLREAVAVKKRLSEAREQQKPALVAALTRARDEMRRSGTVSESTVRALREARGEGRFQSEREKIRDLKERIRSTLTPEQRFALQDLQLGIGGRGRGHHKGRALRHIMVSEPFLSLVEARAR